jgi:hypothetical protein
MTLVMVLALIVVCGLIGTLIGAAIEQTINAQRKAAGPQTAEAKTGGLPTADELNSWPRLAVGLHEVLEGQGPLPEPPQNSAEVLVPPTLK